MLWLVVILSLPATFMFIYLCLVRTDKRFVAGNRQTVLIYALAFARSQELQVNISECVFMVWQT